MPPTTPGLPDSAVRRPGTVVAAPYKPPPTFPTRLTQQAKPIEVQVPPLIAGALVAAFAKALADGLENELLTHYYLGDQAVRVNLDRVLDRLLATFTHELWDELFQFYQEDSPPGAEVSRQVTRLFEGPVRQIVLLLNGPETSRCILDKIGPGLSQRQTTWSSSAGGIDLPLALQLLCGYWHREMPSQSPGGSPDEISRSLHTKIVNGAAARNLISEIRRVLLSPHHVQMHLAESAVWSMLLTKRPYPPPSDGFHIAQFKYECQLFGPLDGIADPQLVNLGSLPAITGTADDCMQTTVSAYVNAQWPRCGTLVLRCLEEAVGNASCSSRHGEAMSGMSVWDGADEDGPHCPGLRLIHIEVEEAVIRMSVSAWTHTMIEIFQQMCWICAALSASPFPGALSECAVEVSNWTYLNESVYVDCSLAHRPVPNGDGMSWLHQMRGAAIASGFPVQQLAPPQAAT
ncbi:DNA-directed RNA polymerase II polypeptide [Purpureocillium lavendulum]|uniref:DNA-directed RNA polymerase II polypeptide n=1 Tax=Purpureocillium lavendulum TaxID=1247861 RepID=A0AB34FM32_9HYPO|nr:DNA-directed RNA polymerase II polypeptide [Purpureocillium lavendulum]